MAIHAGNISGSSTSTGSFGSLVIADKVQGNATFAGVVTGKNATNSIQISDGNVYIGRSSLDMYLHAYSGHIFNNNTGESARFDNSGNLTMASGNSITSGAGIYMDGGGSESERDLGKIKNDVIYGALHA